jgi:pimeloyl-ACP methyl ester carboxylesterase/predicted glycosyltransferase
VRAREPDRVGYVERGGVRVGFEVFGSAGPAIIFLPSWQILHSRQWKLQAPYLARHTQVITYDARGNGRSDRPGAAGCYAHREIVADAVAVLDAVGVDEAVFAGTSMGALYGLQAAAWYPERVRGVVAIGSVAPYVAPVEPGASPFYDVGAAGSVAAFCAERGLPDYRAFVEYFMGEAITEPHRTKPVEDAVGWGLETTPEVLALTVAAREGVTKEAFEDVCRAVRCPVLVVHGDEDGIIPYEHGVALAELLGVGLVTLVGGGHLPSLGDPVRCNLLIREFVDGLAPTPEPPRRWSRALRRRRRALVVSSPIGLGHARRDVAIVDELRALHPDLDVQWLAQHPVTAVLAEHGESVHPASHWLAGESAHVESEAGEHDLHVFQAYRRMDEILVANFMVFHDLVADEHFDLVVADEGWDIDYFLHENPELKRSPFAWLTDFVGWLPMPDGGAAEVALTADYNAEMIEQIARYPRMRDRSIFVGNPDDLVDDPLGPGLPGVREWTTAHFAFAGYVTGAPPVADREALREQLGYRPDERVCVVAVGGSGVGGPLLRRIAGAFPHAAAKRPELRMVVVCGPRIDPTAVPVPPGVEVRGYVPALHRELAACDVAVVQGGLTTTMELVAARRPFLYFPLAHHFEQQVHVPHRLGRYRAGRRMEYAAADPERIAEEVVRALDAPVDYASVETDGARTAARMLAELL